MIEIKYNKLTGDMTGWCGDPKQFGLLKDRGDEEILILDIPIPAGTCSGYAFDGSELIAKPPKPEPLTLEQRVAQLEAQVIAKV